MTLTMVLKKGAYPKEYLCEICKTFCGQTNGEAKNCAPLIYRCGRKRIADGKSKTC